MLNQDLKKCIVWGYRRLEDGSGNIPTNMIRKALLSINDTHSADSSLIEKVNQIKNDMHDSLFVSDYSQAQFMTYFFNNLKNK